MSPGAGVRQPVPVTLGVALVVALSSTLSATPLSAPFSTGTPQVTIRAIDAALPNEAAHGAANGPSTDGSSTGGLSTGGVAIGGVAIGGVAIDGLVPAVLAGLARLDSVPTAARARSGAPSSNTGLHAEIERTGAVRVRVATEDGADLPPVLGRWRLEGERLVFEPRFPFGAGLRFEVELDGPALDALAGTPPGTTPTLREILDTPPVEGPPPQVVAVYPSSGEVPANLLRLYVHFSHPMRRRDVTRFVRLETAEGESIELPFVDIPDGLWDPSGRRLTLFVHPGRVKRGVGPRSVLGPVLDAGRRYRLVVDRGLRDAAGQALTGDFHHEFRATAADRTSPRPAAWTIEPPAASDAPLAVDLVEPMDRALLERMLEIRDPAGKPVPGRVTTLEGERRWLFYPTQSWTNGAYALTVDPAIEDLAGNRPQRLFDVDAGSANLASTATAPVVHRFHVRQ